MTYPSRPDLQGQIIGQNLRHGRELKQERNNAAVEAAVAVASVLPKQDAAARKEADRLKNENKNLKSKVQELEARERSLKASLSSVKRSADNLRNERDRLIRDKSREIRHRARAERSAKSARDEEREKIALDLQKAAYFTEVAIRAECDAAAERARSTLLQKVLDGEISRDALNRVNVHDSEGNPVPEIERVVRKTWRETAGELSRPDLAGAPNEADPIPRETRTERKVRRRVLREKEARQASIQRTTVPAREQKASEHGFGSPLFDSLKP